MGQNEKDLVAIGERKEKQNIKKGLARSGRGSVLLSGSGWLMPLKEPVMFVWVYL